MWWTWLAAYSGPARFTVAADGFDALLAVYTGETYRLEVSTDFRSWTPLTNVVNQAGTVLIQDSNPGAGATRFYRAVEP